MKNLIFIFSFSRFSNFGGGGKVYSKKHEPLEMCGLDAQRINTFKF